MLVVAGDAVVDDGADVAGEVAGAARSAKVKRIADTLKDWNKALIDVGSRDLGARSSHSIELAIDATGWPLDIFRQEPSRK